MGTGLAELAWLLRSMGHLHKEKQRLPRNWGGRRTRTDGEQQKYWPYKRRLSFVCGCESQCVFLWTFVVIKHLVTWYNTSRTVHLEQWWNLSSEKQTHHHFFSWEASERKEWEKCQSFTVRYDYVITRNLICKNRNGKDKAVAGSDLAQAITPSTWKQG